MVTKKGDLLIYVNIWTPKKLSADEKNDTQAIHEFRQLPSQTGCKPIKSFFDRMKEFFHG
jgi:molecular chaperone DnaJ